MAKIRDFLLVICLLNSITLVAKKANEYSIRYYSTNDGLSQNEVTSIIQDKYGFMWFGTRGGLNRFDGYNFKRFKPEPNNANSLHNPSIERLYKDSKGRIWIGTKSGGFSIYDPGKEQFFIPEDTVNMIPDRIISFKEDSLGAIWIGSWNSGVFKLGERLDVRERFQRDFRVSTFEILDDTSVYVGTVRGLYRAGSKTIKKVQTGIGGREITEMLRDKNKPLLWMVGWGLNLSSYNYITHETKEYAIPITEKGNSNAYSIFQDKEGNIWVGTWGHGLYKFNVDDEQFTKISIVPDQVSDFDYNIILDIYEDLMGNVWVGTDGGGIVKISPKSNFKILSDLDNKSIKISALEVDGEGNVWIGTQGSGLLMKDTKGEIHTIPFKTDNKKPLSQVFIRKIHQDINGNIWVNMSLGIHIVQKINNKYQLVLAHKFFNSPDLSGINKVHDVDVDGNKLWIATQQNGLYLLKYENNKYQIKKHFLKSDENDGLTNDRVTNIIYDDLNRMLVSTYGGLLLYNGVDSVFTPVNEIIKDDKKPLCEIIICAINDKKQNIWFGTPCSLNMLKPVGEGVFELNEYTRSNGFSDDYINAIEEDDEGFIWVSTNAGISRLNPETGDIRNFDVSDGLGDTDFSDAASCKGPDGTLYFGGANTVTYFKPGEIVEDDKKPQIVISEFKILNETVIVGNNDILPISINEVDEIILGHKEKEFSFEFSVLDYKAAKRNQYAYWVEGYEQSWNKIGNRRHISFNNLKPSNYKLHIKGTNSHGVWNSNVKTIKIKVQPPPWKTWYAIAVYVFIIVGVVALISMTGIKQERLQNAVKMEKVNREQEKQMNEYKLGFFTNISHEIRTPLTLIIGPIKELMQKDYSELSKNYLSGKLEMIYHNTNRLYNLVNQLLEFRKVEAGKLVLQVGEYSLKQFIDEVCADYKHLAVSKNIKYTVKSASTQKLYFDKERLNVVLYNLLSNAFKYAGEPGVVKVNVEDKDAVVLIIVSNNGIGISKQDEEHLFDRFYQASGNQNMGSSGIGLALVKNYIDLHHGKIYVERTINELTRFTIELKKGKEHFTDAKIIDEDLHSAIANSNIKHDVIQKVNTRSVNNDIKDSTILIVEDNKDVQFYLSELLANHFNIMTADDGFEGFEKAINRIPDLIISDVMMPKMDGFELCEKIKTNDKLLHVPVLLLTAKNTDRDLIFGTKKGADAYLTKPFEPELLIEKAKQLITSRNMLSEKYAQKVTLEPTDKDLNKQEASFINKAVKIIEKHMGNPSFDNDILASEIGMSTATLYRKLKQLTQMAPGEFIKSVKLKRAAQLLSKTNLSVTEIIEEIGFADSKSFRKNFKETFEMLPTEYRKQSKA